MKKILSVGMILLMVLTTGSISLADEVESTMIYPETQQIIEETMVKYDVGESYFANIVSSYEENGYTNAEDLNQGLIEATNCIKESHDENECVLENEILEYEQIVEQNDKSRIVANYNSILAAYLLGIGIVRERGCPYTAESMEHAIVPQVQMGTGWTPDALRYDNDNWAGYLNTTQGFWQMIEGRFQSEVINSGKNVHSLTGSYAFTSENSSLDAYVQLHNVFYSVTFIKKK